MGIFYLKNTNIQFIWMEVYVHSYRDQLSFTYSLWKNGLTADEVGALGEYMRKNNDFIYEKA